jgi:hypothetical protein
MTYTLYRPNGLPCYRAAEACGRVSEMLLSGNTRCSQDTLHGASRAAGKLLLLDLS